VKRFVKNVLAVGIASAATLALAQMGADAAAGWGRGFMARWGAGAMMGGAGPGTMMGGTATGSAMRGVSFQRHRYVMLNGIDAKYVDPREALAPTRQIIEAGRTIFGQSCAACHGSDGRGDGPAAKGLNPPPADLAATIRMPMTTDAYLGWTISEGGAPVGSAMPPFGTAIAGDDLSKLILYLRTLRDRPPLAPAHGRAPSTDPS